MELGPSINLVKENLTNLCNSSSSYSSKLNIQTTNGQASVRMQTNKKEKIFKLKKGKLFQQQQEQKLFT